MLNTSKAANFSPHTGKQTEFLKTTADWVFYGGARGGGKSFTLAWKAALTPRIWHYEYEGKTLRNSYVSTYRSEGKDIKTVVDKISIDYPDYVALLIRRTFPQLERNLKPECDKLYKLYDAIWQERNKCYLFPSGAKVYLVHLKDSKAKDNYIGGNYNFVGVDEANQFPETWILEIATSVRTDNKELKPQVCLTSNPGNMGHTWLKHRFVEKCPPIADGEKIYNEEYDIWYQPQKTGKPYVDSEGITRQFIPATVFDNPTLIKNDKKYVRQLKNLNPMLRAMWLEGRWDVFAGMFFDQWNIIHHVLSQGNFKYGKHFTEKTHTLYRAYDYGTKAPFVCLFAAVDRDENIIIFDEIVETGMSASQQAKEVNEYTKEKYGLKSRDFTNEISDPSYWAKTSEKKGTLYSPQLFYADAGIYLTKGNNDRKAGAKVMYEALRVDESGLPRLRFTDNCNYCIDTIPNLPSAENDPEDVDSSAEDHAYDSARYLCMELLPGIFDAEKEAKGWREKILTGDPDTATAGSWMSA